MQVIDELTKEKVGLSGCKKVMIDHQPEQIIFGYTKHYNNSCCEIVGVFTKRGNIERHVALIDRMKDKLFYSNYTGMYMSKIDCPEEVYIREKYILGRGGFPYNFERRYEAIESFRLFKGKQKLVEPEIDYPLSKYLKYTIGLEFETSMGYIPQNICFRDGLIPLRDGSIGGLEYSTVVLDGNFGLGLLKQQCETLKQYTAFNKECSLHIHLGNFPMIPEKVYNLYLLCYGLQDEGSFVGLLPNYTFNSAKYKASGKDYCKKLPVFDSFKSLYRGLVGRPFFGDFTQPHPSDPERCRKWNIGTRYFWINFINLLCYKVNKTVEFRFLRPTFNYRKITVWLYIINAILIYAETHDITLDNCHEISLQNIIDAIYPEPELNKKLKIEIFKLSVVGNNQSRNGDKIGADTIFEENLFDCNEII